MSIVCDEKDLPEQVTLHQAVEAAYAAELAEVAAVLARGVPVLVECDKDLTPFLVHLCRTRLQAAGLACTLVDGRPRPDRHGTTPAGGALTTMIAQLREAVRGPLGRRVLALPHCDLLTAGRGGLSPEAREVLPLLYENPEVLWLGFRDPSFPLPRAVEALFPRRLAVLGVPRERLRHLVTRAESRKLGRPLSLAALHRHVSGMNAVRLRRALEALDGEDHPADPRAAWQHIRRATLTGRLEVPAETLDRDVGGYAGVKRRLGEAVLDVVALRDGAGDAAALAEAEALIPRGLLFAGPATGKLLFARALAGSLGAALLTTSGADLRARGIGGGEHELRRLFLRARQAAPAVVVIDELDTFAARRRGVGASLRAQLLTEMDRLPRTELVLVAGITRRPDRLDPVLLRPGRFELQLGIAYPDAGDRRDILRLYDDRLRLRLTEEALERAVEATAGDVPGGPPGARWSGDHLHALCRTLARRRLLDHRADATGPDDVHRALEATFSGGTAGA
jgi:cell division protease FtsH